jgi:hypothetical protein
MLETDYLVVGSGAGGMIFADQALSETDASIIIVDRHHMPGGHWNDAYSFVRLHQPSAFYGAGSLQLGGDSIDQFGLNKGYYELATGAEIVSYFDKLMNTRFIPSGRVQYYPMCDYLGDGKFVSRLSGEMHEVVFRKRLVLTNFLNTQVPSTHSPCFEVAEGVKLVTPNLLPECAPGYQRFVVIGGGKTAMDVGIWLLQMGVKTENIRWIIPRDSWLQNRDAIQPGDAFFERTAGGLADQFEAAAEASSVEDLFDRLERKGQMLRIDRTVTPTVYRGATLSPLEVEALGAIKNVVRKGYAKRIERDRIILARGMVAATPGDLYVDCTARAFTRRRSVPIFEGDRITLQPVRAGRTSLSYAVIGHVEASYSDDSIKNYLCAPIPVPDITADWPRDMLADLRIAQRWAADKMLRSWVAEHRLSGAGFATAAAASSPQVARIRARLKEARPRAETNLQRLVGGIDQHQQNT